ncbi:MAG: hydantoinase/oxoprolinase N-terminal domain-containing protein, partial [Terriglobia bacterium]
MRIGVDTGGTFTDCVAFEGAAVRVLKVFTDLGDPASAILDATRRLAGAGITEPLTLIHGTTAGTNTVLERRGARVALVTTAGFEDVIEIGRQNRPRLYDLNVERDPPLVPRSLRWGARERTAAGGRILLRPNTAEIRRLLARVKRSKAEAVAVCFLFSFANPANERAIARAIRKLGLPVSVSHEILPEFREYERLSTVVLNAYLTPRVGRYLARLQQAKRHPYG